MTRRGRKEVTMEERIQKACEGGWNWKQWRWEDGVGRSEVRRMQLTAVEAGRIHWVSHWFENSGVVHKTCHPDKKAPGHGRIQIVGMAGTCQMKTASFRRK
jgi:hypothetical protein